MNAAALDLSRRLGEEGPHAFSQWNAPLFDAYRRNVLPALWERLAPSGADRAFRALATLVQRGIGEGLLKTGLDAPPRGFLEACLREWLPEVLAETPSDDLPALLARVWNLGEGLAREPEWVNAFVVSQLDRLRGRADLEAALIAVLRPLLEPAGTASWAPPFRTTLLPLRPADDAFLPGEIQLAAPNVIVVSDRRRPARLGVHLRREGQSAVLGAFGPIEPFHGATADLSITWKGAVAVIGGTRVKLPFLAELLQWTVVPAGFLIASSLDSQKLWIVECGA